MTILKTPFMTHMTTQQSQFAVDAGIGPGDTRNADAKERA
jgi:hypothetical protein